MSGGWGFSGLVAGLESKLDAVLADDSQASAKARAAAEAQKKELMEKKAIEKERLQAEQGVSRASSRGSRPNSRLQERLAKAVQQRSESPRASVDVPSRPDSPATRSSTPASEPSRTITAEASVTPTTSKNVEDKAEDAKSEPEARPSADSAPPSVATTNMSIPTILTPEPTSPRMSMESNPSRPSVDAAVAGIESATPRSAETLETELAALQKSHEESVRAHQEETHANLERIDALQTKLTYLAQQLASAAKASAADSETIPADKKLAEKDAQIAALLEEGQNLSKKEMKYMTTIKKMRANAQEKEKETTSLKQRLAKAEKAVTEQSERARRAEAAEKAAKEDRKIIDKIEKDLKIIQSEREEANLTITELRRQLSDAISRAEDAEKRAQTGALEAEKRATALLKEDIESLRIEKKLAEDRGKRELQEAKEEATRQKEKAQVTELELRNEIANLETKLELLRSRSEEVSSSATGDSQAKLLRQIETLQTQYAVASENWQGIESTLTSRITSLEKERDDTAKRESDIRKKAREVNSKARKLEDELESINERARNLEQDLTEQRALVQRLQARLMQAEKAAEEARADLEQERKVMEANFQHKLEEERLKWQSQFVHSASNHLRTASPSMSRRRDSPDPQALGRRATGMPRTLNTEIPLSPMEQMLVDDRRPSTARSRTFRSAPDMVSPVRQDSASSSLFYANGNSAHPSQPPSIAFDHDDTFHDDSPPLRSINDMMSISTAGAGPSVQLVEKLSATARRLESEKATHKEEIERLTAQLEESRETVVSLMREADEKRALDEKVDKLEKELSDVKHKYDTTLEMLGEKTEREMELESDIVDLKKMYRELVVQIQG